jgi:hypothetical protein
MARTLFVSTHSVTHSVRYGGEHLVLLVQVIPLSDSLLNVHVHTPHTLTNDPLCGYPVEHTVNDIQVSVGVPP